jgi:hypothetical protein
MNQTDYLGNQLKKVLQNAHAYSSPFVGLRRTVATSPVLVTTLKFTLHKICIGRTSCLCGCSGSTLSTPI